jgi:type I restriction enzyme M protein
MTFKYFKGKEMSEVEVFESGVELRSKVGINIAEKSAAIRNIADMLRGLYKPHEYSNVIISLTVIKRFNDEGDYSI